MTKEQQDVLRIGSAMSNWIHNLCHSDDLADHYKARLKELVEQWDEAQRALRESIE